MKRKGIINELFAVVGVILLLVAVITLLYGFQSTQTAGTQGYNQTNIFLSIITSIIEVTTPTGTVIGLAIIGGVLVIIGIAAILAAKSGKEWRGP